VRQQHDGEYAAIAKGLTKQNRQGQQSHEPDDVVLRQEQIVSAMYSKLQDTTDDLEAICGDSAAQLARLWAQHSDTTTKEGRMGPSSGDAFTRANYLASLLLRLHHPHTSKSVHASRQQRSSAIATRIPTGFSTVPAALLDWLETYHNPYPDDFNLIHVNQPSPSAHDRFWDVIFSSLSRGRFQRVIRLLRDAGWDRAVTAQDDYPNHGASGYGGHHLQNIETVIGQCIRLLVSSPALQYDDWDVKGPDWALFRQRVRQAVKDLESFAGEDSGVQADSRNVFYESAGFGQSMNMSTLSRRAESKVPWTIYENLKQVYGQLLGNDNEVVDTSQDWLEASIYLTVWWNGEDGSAGPAGLLRSSMRKSITASQKTREVDVATTTAYCKRLAKAVVMATEPDEAVFQPQTLDPVEVALGCLMEGSLESLLAMIRGWSISVASALVEVAAMGGWLPQARPRSRGLLDQGFSSEDLMVLSHGPGSQPQPQQEASNRDDVLAEYAEFLARNDIFKSKDGKIVREGWELAVSTADRLDDTARGQRITADMLDKIELTDEARVDKVLTVCADLELNEYGRTIAEVTPPSFVSNQAQHADILDSATPTQFWQTKRGARHSSTTPALTLPPN